jgi:hypothetical protein
MNTSDYNYGARLLHRIVLGSPTLTELSFDIECAVHGSGRGPVQSDERHVFVSGLARSGTTALMRCFYETGLFASLTYADMPFILAPNLWSSLSFAPKHTELKERAHKDGILVNVESPEALDEVFWKVFLHDNYILPDRLILHDSPEPVLAQYDRYLHLVIRKNDQGRPLRYLSKNNNNILRFRALLSRFPRATIIIPFREPLQHALSLLAQHRHFIRLQSDDPFILEYMNWIGHHEFGSNHKLFDLQNAAVMQRMAQFDKSNINYWLLTWLNYYSYALAQFATNCLWFSHETFCQAPTRSIQQLFEHIGLPALESDLAPFQAKTRADAEADKRILKDCLSVYEQLMQRTADQR